MKKAAALSFILLSFFVLGCQDSNQTKTEKEPQKTAKKEAVKNQENKTQPQKKPSNPGRPAKEKKNNLPLAQVMLKNSPLPPRPDRVMIAIFSITGLIKEEDVIQETSSLNGKIKRGGRAAQHSAFGFRSMTGSCFESREILM